MAGAIVKKAICDLYSPFDWLGYVPFDPARPKKTSPPDPVAVDVDPTILPAYTGAYEMQPANIIEVKFEDERLFIKSQDGQSWMPLLAETEERFFIPEGGLTTALLIIALVLRNGRNGKLFLAVFSVFFVASTAVLVSGLLSEDLMRLFGPPVMSHDKEVAK